MDIGRWTGVKTLTKKADRIAEIAIIVLLVLLGFQFIPGRTPASEASIDVLARAKAVSMSPAQSESFRKELGQVRLVVDSNGDASTLLEALEEKYSGRHEVWSLGGRHAEAAGNEPEALLRYARAVRLHPDYLDEGSGDFLGTRIERLNDLAFKRLTGKKKSAGLTRGETETLKVVYFLRRRFAGGCE